MPNELKLAGKNKERMLRKKTQKFGEQFGVKIKYNFGRIWNGIKKIKTTKTCHFWTPNIGPKFLIFFQTQFSFSHVIFMAIWPYLQVKWSRKLEWKKYGKMVNISWKIVEKNFPILWFNNFKFLPIYGFRWGRGRKCSIFLLLIFQK